MKKIEVIKKLSFFESFMDYDLQEIDKYIALREFSSGQTILDEEEFNTSLFFLVKGEVEIILDNDVVAKIKKFGNVFGEMSIAGNKGSFAMLKSSGESLFLVFDFLSVESVSDEKRDRIERLMYKSFSKVLANRLAKANKTIQKLKSSP